MQKYKSIKTFERLSKIHPPNPKYELSSLKEIDQKFREITFKTRQALFPETALIESSKEPQRSVAVDNMKQAVPLALRKDETKLQIIPEGNQEGLGGLVDLQFKLQFSKNMQQQAVNPIVQYFGSTLIATAFQCLVVKSLEDTLKLKLNFEAGMIPTSTNVLKVFDINPNNLNALKSQQEKNQYIVEQMNTVINQLLKQWKDKVYLKEKRYREQDMVYEAEAKNNLRQKQYKWLTLKTKYNELRNKLRQIIVDKLNDYENQTLAIQAHAERQEIKKQGGNPNNVKLMLTNTNIVTTRTIFENMEKFGQSKEFHFLKSLGPDRLEKIKNRKEKSDSQIQNSSIPAQQKYDVQWDPQQEHIFLNQRSKTRLLFTNEVGSSNWNDLGLLPILQQLNLQEKKKVQREHILNKYASGEWLTAQELQFLANTSSLLNACLDKEFFQHTANIIDKDLLQNIELQLAENILCDYEEMKQATSQARLQYIRQKIVVTKDNIQKQIKEDYRRSEVSKNLDFNRKYVKVFTTVIRHMDRLGKFEEKIPNDVPGANFLHQYLNGKISQKDLISRLKSLREQHTYDNDDFHNTRHSSSIPEQRNPIVTPTQGQLTEQRMQYYRQMSRPKSTLTPGFRKEVTRHKYHPSSKVFVKQNAIADEEDNAGYMKKLRDKYNLQEQEKFQLHLKSHPALKFPRYFSNFYSGGPPTQVETRIFDNINTNQPIQATAREIKAVTLIQRKLRSVLKEKKLRQQITNRRKDIFYFFKDNCELMLNTIENEKHDEGLQNMLLTKQIEKAKQAGKQSLGLVKNQDDEPTVDDEGADKSVRVKQSRRQTVMLTSTDLTGLKRVQSTKAFQISNAQRTQTTIGSVNMTPSARASHLQSTAFSVQKNQLKQQQLLDAAQRGKFMMIISSKFTYSAMDINVQNKAGDTALHFVVLKGDQQFIQWLLDEGANPNLPNNMGNTPLHHAFKKDKYDIIRLLLNFGGDLNCVNNNGQTPLAFGTEKMLRIFQLEKGVATLDSKSIIMQAQTTFNNNDKVIRNESHSERENMVTSIKLKSH